jgi:hypothetical protein
MREQVNPSIPRYLISNKDIPSTKAVYNNLVITRVRVYAREGEREIGIKRSKLIAIFVTMCNPLKPFIKGDKSTTLSMENSQGIGIAESHNLLELLSNKYILVWYKYCIKNRHDMRPRQDLDRRDAGRGPV